MDSNWLRLNATDSKHEFFMVFSFLHIVKHLNVYICEINLFVRSYTLIARKIENFVNLSFSISRDKWFCTEYFSTYILREIKGSEFLRSKKRISHFFHTVKILSFRFFEKSIFSGLGYRVTQIKICLFN